MVCTHFVNAFLHWGSIELDLLQNHPCTSEDIISNLAVMDAVDEGFEFLYRTNKRPLTWYEGSQHTIFSAQQESGTDV